MRLDLYKEIKGLSETNQHEKFLLLKNEFQFKYEKEILSNWTDGLLDRDNKFVRQFQETFHSSFWEIYLYKLFKEAKFKLNQEHPMPDYIITEPIECYVEAVTANIKQNGRKEKDRGIEDIISMTIPPALQDDFYEVLDESIIRAANAIKTKNKKYNNEYIKREWIDVNNPYTIAMGSYDQVNYGREYIYPMLALLYGIYYDVEADVLIKKDKIIKKDTNSEIQLDIFSDSEYENVSAVIYSCTMTLGKLVSMSISEGNESFNNVYNIRKKCDDGMHLLHVVSEKVPEDIADGTFIFHNPNAKNKLPEDFFDEVAVTQFYYENNQLIYKGNIAPIIARINTTKVLAPIFENMIKASINIHNMMISN
ncbi:hypothetical protein OQL15_000839 [Clostridium perfringens]